MAIDYTTPLGQVRLQIPDVTATPLFTDDQINAFITMAGDSVDHATARALRAIASNMVMVLKYIKDHDLTVDGTVVSKELRALATDLEISATRNSSGFALVAVPYDFTEDSWESDWDN